MKTGRGGQLNHSLQAQNYYYYFIHDTDFGYHARKYLMVREEKEEEK